MHVCMYDVILNKTKVMIHSQEEDLSLFDLTSFSGGDEFTTPYVFAYLYKSRRQRRFAHTYKHCTASAFELVAHRQPHFLHSLFDQMQKRLNIIQNFKDHERSVLHTFSFT